jgi:hypothetical protein
MKLINKLRKYVHSIIFINKIKRGAQEGLKEFHTLSLKEFINTYEYSNSALKNWIYESVKKVYEEVDLFNPGS